jgi:YD repeat-containing protein
MRCAHIPKVNNLPSQKDVPMYPPVHRLSAVIGAALIAYVIAPQNAMADTSTVTQISYDAGDHVVSVTDPRGLVTSYSYDGLGQLWQQVSPDTGTTSISYDAFGRFTSMTRADGTTTTYGYDALSRLVSVSAGGPNTSPRLRRLH